MMLFCIERRLRLSLLVLGGAVYEKNLSFRTCFLWKFKVCTAQFVGALVCSINRNI
jgi:hypothetical protein